MKRAIRLLAFCIFGISLSTAQTPTVKRNVVLRTRASSSSKAITTLKPPATMTLINPAAMVSFVYNLDVLAIWIYCNAAA